MSVSERPQAPLSNSRLFTGMPEPDRQAILAASVHKTLRKGQVLLRQGEPASAFYLIERGYLKLTQVTADGAEVIVRFVGPWDPVGGVAALGEAPYPVTATAVDAAEIRSWPRAQLSSLLEAYPLLKTNILRAISAHMDDALTRLRELATLKVSQRLAHTLLRLTAPAQADEAGHRAVPHTLTRQELAELTGTTLFTVSRILTDWEGEGLVKSSRAHVEVLDAAGLKLAAEGDGE